MSAEAVAGVVTSSPTGQVLMGMHALVLASTSEKSVPTVQVEQTVSAEAVAA